MIRYDDRVAIVTGAGGGLGRSHALFLASRGAKVVVNDPGGSVDGSGTGDAADLVVEEIRAAGGEAIADKGSVSDFDAAKSLVQAAINEWGRLDIVVNNAGILRDKSFTKMEQVDWDSVIAVHLTGSAYVTHAAWPHLREGNYGRIINTTSASGLYGNFGQANYGAAKMGLVGLTNALCQEGKKNNILVNAVAPVAATRMTETMFPPDMLEKVKPDYITAAVGYFASDACAVSGQVVEVAAGHYARVAVVEATGVTFGADATVEPDDLAARWDEIADLSAAKPYGSMQEVVMKIFGAVAQA